MAFVVSQGSWTVVGCCTWFVVGWFLLLLINVVLDACVWSVGRQVSTTGSIFRSQVAGCQWQNECGLVFSSSSLSHVGVSGVDVIGEFIVGVVDGHPPWFRESGHGCSRRQVWFAFVVRGNALRPRRIDDVVEGTSCYSFRFACSFPTTRLYLQHGNWDRWPVGTAAWQRLWTYEGGIGQALRRRRTDEFRSGPAGRRGWWAAVLCAGPPLIVNTGVGVGKTDDRVRCVWGGTVVARSFVLLDTSPPIQYDRINTNFWFVEVVFCL